MCVTTSSFFSAQTEKKSTLLRSSFDAMEVDKYILTEALSAILGVTVKLQSDCNGLDGAINLHITSLTTLALLGYESFMSVVVQPVSYLTSLLAGLFFGDQKNQETPTNKSASCSIRKELFVIPDDFFDPMFDFDFTNMSKPNSESCMRGDEPYQRPYGWMRFALKVRDIYPDGNAWLGSDGWRSRSAPGEWQCPTTEPAYRGLRASYSLTIRRETVRLTEEGFIHLQTSTWQMSMQQARNSPRKRMERRTKSSCRTESTPRKGT